MCTVRVFPTNCLQRTVSDEPHGNVIVFTLCGWPEYLLKLK